jgi:hypothetical protein
MGNKPLKNRGVKMSERYDKRTKGSMARRLDSDKLLEIGINLQKAIYADPDLDTAGWFVEPLVVLLGENNEWSEPKVSVVCSEGVGWQSDQYRKAIFWIDTNGYGQAIKCEVANRALLSALTDEEVDLADFVRVFGDRLETNLGIWQYQMRDVPQNFQPFIKENEPA